MPVGAMRGTRVDVAVETDRELLWAVLNERADDLPTEALCAVAAAADELRSTLAWGTWPRYCAPYGSGCRRRPGP